MPCILPHIIFIKNVYIKGFVGNLGTYILIDEKYEELCSYFNKEFIDKTKKTIYDSMYKDGINPSLTICSGSVIDKEEMQNGGFLTALWKICERNKWGIEYNLRNVPILQGTVEVANYFDINPYRLLTKDSFIYVVEEDNYKDYISIDEKYIGQINKSKKRVRIDGESESFLTKDFKDEIDKVIYKFTKRR